MTPGNDVRAHDPHVEKAIEAMRREPARRWTVASLARVGGLSRAPFARRFRRATGTSPLRWLARLRLDLAKSLVGGGERSLAEIAPLVGYTTEFALSKAFKRMFGIAPRVYRRRLVAVHRTAIRAAA